MFTTPPIWDLTLLQFINQNMRFAIFDLVMPILSSPIFLWLCALATLPFLRSDKYKLVTACLALLLAIGASDVSCNALKNLTGRIRPLHSIEKTWYLEDGSWQQRPSDIKPDTRSGSSFPSAHAANSAAASIVLFFVFRKKTIFLLPILIGYSRIYLGKHFPLDVFAGWMLGLCIGLIIYVTSEKFEKFISQKLRT